MKRKFCLIMLLACLLSFVGVLPAGAVQDISWASLTYIYDPDTEGAVPQSGKFSFEQGKENYLHRASTVMWDHERADLYLDGTLCEGGSLYLWEAGNYELRLQSKASEESYTCLAVLLPVIKVGEQYFEFDEKTKEFLAPTFMTYPVIECANVTTITLDDGVMDAEKIIHSGDTVERLGDHSLSLSSNGRAWFAPFCVSACTAQIVYDEALGKNCMLLTVGDFPGAFSVLLDEDTALLPSSEYRLTEMGQHKLRATLDGREIDEKGALPSEQALCLQLAILLPSATIKEPFVLHLSRWDADFYMDGERIEGDYRITAAGEHVFYALDENGKRIENAFLLKTSPKDAGTSYTELTINFRSPHILYALLVILPVLALIAAAVYFFLQRRRIV